jgi:hypothetical protein
MSTQDIQQDKLKLINWISQSQGFSLLQKIKCIFEEEAIVAYSADGRPLTLKTYNKNLHKAEKDIENGRVISSEELLKKVDSWKK